jgi:hypothetical protein
MVDHSSLVWSVLCVILVSLILLPVFWYEICQTGWRVADGMTFVIAEQGNRVAGVGSGILESRRNSPSQCHLCRKILIVPK